METRRVNLLDIKPAWAKAVILAELREDDSDIMSDYHASHTVRTVALAWSRHNKDLFPEMRKAAALFPETKHLGPGCDIYTVKVVLSQDIPHEYTNGIGGYFKGSPSHWHSELYGDTGARDLRFTTLSEVEAFMAGAPKPEPIRFGLDNAGGFLASFQWAMERRPIEHREKYSMGHGYYLKAGGRDDSGWEVNKNAYLVRYGDSEMETIIGVVSTPDTGAAGGVSGVTMSLNAEKHGVELRFPEKPSDDIRSALKAAGWRWSGHSGCWYTKDTPDARAFAAEMVNSSQIVEAASLPGTAPDTQAWAEKAAQDIAIDAAFGARS